MHYHLLLSIQSPWLNSYSFLDKNFAFIAVDFNFLPIFDDLGRSGDVSHGGNAVFSGDDGSVGKDAASFHYQAPRAWK